MRLAAIDVGTNSVHMVVAGATRGGGFEVEDREREVTQIGRGSFVAGRLQRPAVQATLDALSRMVKLARRRDVDRILCVATAAVREARNGGQFLQAAREACGITPRVIPAEEEGRLIYLAVRAAVALGAEPAMILDIGGGSMQMIVGDKDALRLVVSAPLGALRLQETHLPTDPPSRGDLQKLQRHIRKLAAEPLRSVLRYAPARVYGSSGSIHALAQLAALDATGAPLAQLNGASLTLESLERLTRRLRKMSLAQRAVLRGLDARRAEIILPGAMVLMHVLEALGADRIVITDFGLREGLVTDYVTAHAREISNAGEVEDLRMRSVIDLLQRFQPEERHLRHARHVASLALAMFDGLRAQHELGEDVRRLLEYGALLHDVGAVVGYDRHAEHSYYLIKNGNLRGLDAHEVEMIALVAGYHGHAQPRKRHEAVKRLPKRARRALRWMSAILRVAEALDRSHFQLVRSVRVERRGPRLTLLLDARRGAELELWAARRRVDLLEKMLDARVRVELEAAPERKQATARRTAAHAPAAQPAAALRTPAPAARPRIVPLPSIAAR